MSKPDSGTAVEQEEPAIEEGKEKPDEKPQDKAKAEDKADERRNDDGPPVDSPRWKEVYGKWKDTQRRLEERENDVDAIREHNRALEARLNAIEQKKAEIHGEDKYLSMIKIAERDMAKDTELKKKIWGAPNPAKEAFKYGEKRAKEMEDKEREEQSRETTNKQTQTEPSDAGGGGSDDAPEEKLTEAEVRVCRNLFPDMKLEDAKKKYLKQKKALGRQ